MKKSLNHFLLAMALCSLPVFGNPLETIRRSNQEAPSAVANFLIPLFPQYRRRHYPRAYLVRRYSLPRSGVTTAAVT